MAANQLKLAIHYISEITSQRVFKMRDNGIKYRVIGIRYALKVIREAGLISDGIHYPEDAAAELLKTKNKSLSARRHRAARKDAPIPTIVSKIEEVFDLPPGSVQLVYPSGTKAKSNATVGSLRKNWYRHYGEN
ncbi:Uncharacterized protein ChrSV_1684 [Chromobacterium vaccinii]|nr:Uncharacterized protein ChrSW_1684 [Chromobacterium vaccinii]QND89142.1 Uncharacterized protein ChrSV_1684 [Chromobacterium vaccinii]